MAQAAANECGAVFFGVRPSDILSKFQGDSEKFIKNTFQTAKTYKKSIIFFDGKYA